MRAAPRALATMLAIAAFSFVPAAAEHEVYYRFTVLGYVMDARGKPVADAPVEVVRDKTGFTYLGATDGQGLYVVLTRLGDESRGEALTVRQGARERRVTAVFDPANHVDERGTQVDFEGARVIERAASFRATLLSVVGASSRH